MTLNEYFNKYSKLVQSIAHKFSTKYHRWDYDDLYQEGCLALINTYGKFDVNCNTTYLYISITNHLNRVILGNDYESNKLRNKINKYLKNGYQLSEILTILKISYKRYLNLYEKTCILEIMTDFARIDDNLAYIDICDQLSIKERELFDLLYKNGLSIKEIAEIKKMSYESIRLQVSQIVQKIEDCKNE